MFIFFFLVRLNIYTPISPVLSEIWRYRWLSIPFLFPSHSRMDFPTTRNISPRNIPNPTDPV